MQMGEYSTFSDDRDGQLCQFYIWLSIRYDLYFTDKYSTV